MKQRLRQFIQLILAFYVVLAAGCALNQQQTSYPRPMSYQSVWDMPVNKVVAMSHKVAETIGLRDPTIHSGEQFNMAIREIKRGNYDNARNILDGLPSQQLTNEAVARKNYLLAKIQMLEHQQTPGTIEYSKLAEAKRLQQQAVAELNNIQADIAKARARQDALQNTQQVAATVTPVATTEQTSVTSVPNASTITMATANAKQTATTSNTTSNGAAQTTVAKKSSAPQQSLNKIEVALLVPISGTQMKKGTAVRDGFFAAYAKASPADHQRIKIRIYDIALSPDRAALYQMAKAQGADVVIEPLGLMKSSTQSYATIGEHAFKFATQDMKL